MELWKAFAIYATIVLIVTSVIYLIPVERGREFQGEFQGAKTIREREEVSGYFKEGERLERYYKFELPEGRRAILTFRALEGRLKLFSSGVLGSHEVKEFLMGEITSHGDEKKMGAVGPSGWYYLYVYLPGVKGNYFTLSLSYVSPPKPALEGGRFEDAIEIGIGYFEWGDLDKGRMMYYKFWAEKEKIYRVRTYPRVVGGDLMVTIFDQDRSQRGCGEWGASVDVGKNIHRYYYIELWALESTSYELKVS